MDKMKTITKSLLVGMGILFLLQYPFNYYSDIIIPITILICSFIIAYIFIFKSEKVYKLLFKDTSSKEINVTFKINCLSVFVTFFAVLSFIDLWAYFVEQISFLLYIPKAIIDSIVYKEWLLTMKYEIKQWLIGILTLLIFILNVYFIVGSHHFIKLIIKLENKNNV